MTAALLGSSSGVAIAKKTFDLNALSTMQSPDHEIAFTVSRQPVPGLGDQAVAQIFQPGKTSSRRCRR